MIFPLLLFHFDINLLTWLFPLDKQLLISLPVGSNSMWSFCKGNEEKLKLQNLMGRMKKTAISNEKRSSLKQQVVSPSHYALQLTSDNETARNLIFSRFTLSSNIDLLLQQKLVGSLKTLVDSS